MSKQEDAPLQAGGSAKSQDLRNTDDLFAIRGGATLDRGRLWLDVRNLARELPPRPYVLNLCEDRYLFCITFLAALCRGQVSLLPPSDQAGVLRDILDEFPEGYVASDRERPPLARPRFQVRPPHVAGTAPAMDFEAGQTAVIAFTSGSTGRPKACLKTWGTLKTAAQLALRGLALENARLTVISTTPPQHMYGLETSVLWPLFSPLVLHAGRPFFPEDIRRTVGNAPLPCLLATTPTHLRALVRTEGEWKNLCGVISSTANLAETLARRAEQTTNVSLREIYGSTETLSFAMRQTANEGLWQPYPEVILSQDGEGAVRLTAPHLDEPAHLEDLFQVEPDGRFAVLGRSGDLVKIGGKRSSLAELNRRLTDIEGIADGLFFTVEDERGECRLAAVVVSALSRGEILAALRPVMDPVFLPRRIHYLEEIPRTAVGKVAKEMLEKLLSSLDRPNR